jgi:hypothetical protein
MFLKKLNVTVFRRIYFTQPFLTNKVRLDQMQGDPKAIAFKASVPNLFNCVTTQQKGMIDLVQMKNRIFFIEC